MQQWAKNQSVEILGNLDPARRVGIVSFNLRDARGRYLHPKFVTVLLNDLFGIQSRAGCSCAGPYGHRLLGIDQVTSELYRDWVRKGFQGIKPGWCRVGFHFSMDDADAQFITDAVDFVARHGHCFLPLYAFDSKTGMWTHREFVEKHEHFSIEAALESKGCEQTALPAAERVRLYAQCLQEARETAARLGEPKPARAARPSSSASYSSSISSAGRRKPGPGPDLSHVSSAIAPPACDTSCRANCSARNASPRSRMK